MLRWRFPKKIQMLMLMKIFLRMKFKLILMTDIYVVLKLHIAYLDLISIIVPFQSYVFHLPGNRNCTFREGDELQKVVNREKFKRSQLEAFFQLNIDDRNARKYTYDEIPCYYVWNALDCVWTVRKKGNQIGRLLHCHHTSGEIWYLRLLLTKVRGPTSFDNLKTVGGWICKTFKEACQKYGFLDDDNEWDELMTECSKCGFPGQIRELFVHIIVNCQVSDIRALWNKHWKEMSHDILMQQTRQNQPADTILSGKQLQFKVLAGEYFQRHLIFTSLTYLAFKFS